MERGVKYAPTYPWHVQRARRLCALRIVGSDRPLARLARHAVSRPQGRTRRRGDVRGEEEEEGEELPPPALCLQETSHRNRTQSHITSHFTSAAQRNFQSKRHATCAHSCKCRPYRCTLFLKMGCSLGLWCDFGLRIVLHLHLDPS